MVSTESLRSQLRGTLSVVGNNMALNVIWLDDSTSNRRELVGGKAANLSQLYSGGQVPLGFCITTSATARVIPGRSGQTSLPPDLYAEIEAAYAKLGTRCGTPESAVAIRSSAVAEDGAVNTFAGQYQTLLNVVGVEAVVAAIVECVEAAYQPHAAAYRKHSGERAAEVHLALLVQEFVAADASAVAFTANPVTNDASEIVINAHWGLGEGLVDGSSVPDTYIVDKRKLRIKTRSVAEKERMCATRPTGTIEIDVPAANRSRPTLTDDQVGEVCRSAIDLEARMGWPVDLECAFKDGKLYLLQCRPVTTIAQCKGDWSVEWDDPKDAELTWRKGSLETPLDQSFEWYWMQGWAKARRETGSGTLPMRIYVNGYGYEAEKPFKIGNRKAQEAARKKTEREIPKLWQSEWLPELKRKRAYFRSLDLSALSNDELASVLVEALPWYCECARMHAHLGGTAVEVVGCLVEWYRQRFPNSAESEPYRLVQGQSNLSVEKGHLLWQLQQHLTPANKELLRAALQSRKKRGRWDGLAGSFKEVFDRYLETYWKDSPEFLASLILKYDEQGVEDPHVKSRQLAIEREQFTEYVRSRLKKQEREVFEELLPVALANYPLTEDHNYWVDGIAAHYISPLFDELGRRMIKGGILKKKRSEIKFLELNEIILWGFGVRQPLHTRVVERQREFDRRLQLSPPDFLGACEEPPTEKEDYLFWGPSTPLEAPKGAVRGVGASPGMIRGRARVVANLDEALELQPGDILVCGTTNPHWTPFFAVAAGLVSDRGGALCHGAVVAREYGLPAVVGTLIGTKKIKTGQLIEVDGQHGVIRLL